jgi:membrane protein
VLGNVVIGTAFWTWTPSILLGRRADWRRLLPAGLITALLFAAAGIWVAVFVPDQIASYTHRYGLVGVALALVSYLAVLGLMVVTGIVMGAAIDQGRQSPAESGHAP